MKKLIYAVAVGLFAVACSSGGSSDSPKDNAKETEAVEQTEKAADPNEPPAEIQALLQQHTCLTCHKVEEKLVGPAYKQVALRNYTNEEIVELIYEPKPENWPDYPPMAALPNVPEEDALKIAAWINSLNPRNN